MEMRLKKLVRSHYQYNVPISLEKKQKEEVGREMLNPTP